MKNYLQRYFNHTEEYGFLRYEPPKKNDTAKKLFKCSKYLTRHLVIVIHPFVGFDVLAYNYMSMKVCQTYFKMAFLSCN